LDTNYELNKKATILKLALRTYGVNIKDEVEGVGSLIKENINGLYKIDSKKGLRPNELILHNKITTKLVYNNNSPFELSKKNEEFYIGITGEKLINVNFPKRPEHYSKKTTSGTPMKNVAQVMGLDCLAIAVDKQCHYFTNGDFCRYCNITPTNKKSKLDRISKEQDIAETIDFAGHKYKYFDLTGGTFEDRDEECRNYTKLGNLIRENLGRNSFSGPFSLSPPKNLSLLEDLFKTGVDVISFNPDIYTDEAFKEICPGKYKIGKKHYDEALNVGKTIFGEGNMVVQYMIGPWESNEELFEGVKYHLDKGILVNLTTFQPSPGSKLRNIHPKSLQDLIEIYIEYGDLVRKSGLFPNSRNSILTSESANRSSISNEVVKGFLTKETYDDHNDLKFLRGLKNE
tara:strand:- start:1221 stop:2423 length:1203 start_codon:yes stop_codon:yes gene_type:complete